MRQKCVEFNRADLGVDFHPRFASIKRRAIGSRVLASVFVRAEELRPKHSDVAGAPDLRRDGSIRLGFAVEK